MVERWPSAVGLCQPDRAAKPCMKSRIFATRQKAGDPFENRRHRFVVRLINMVHSTQAYITTYSYIRSKIFLPHPNIPESKIFANWQNYVFPEFSTTPPLR